LGGKEGIKLCKEEYFDIVLVDLVMPGLNGAEACLGIKKVSPKTEVILISGFPQEIEAHLYDFISAGGVDLVLRKPLLNDEIENAINKFVKDKKI